MPQRQKVSFSTRDIHRCGHAIESRRLQFPLVTSVPAHLSTIWVPLLYFGLSNFYILGSLTSTTTIASIFGRDGNSAAGRGWRWRVGELDARVAQGADRRDGHGRVRGREVPVGGGSDGTGHEVPQVPARHNADGWQPGGHGARLAASPSRGRVEARHSAHRELRHTCDSGA